MSICVGCGNASSAGPCTTCPINRPAQYSAPFWCTCGTCWRCTGQPFHGYLSVDWSSFRAFQSPAQLQADGSVLIDGVRHVYVDGAWKVEPLV